MTIKAYFFAVFDCQYEQPTTTRLLCDQRDWYSELSVPEDGKVVADLIFVHGLKGHPRKT